jgi:hypothetical protein
MFAPIWSARRHPIYRLIEFTDEEQLLRLRPEIRQLIEKNSVVSRSGWINQHQGLDAILEIKGRSGNNVVVSNIDSTGVGWDKALQPVLGVPTGVGANQNWWVKFRLTFYKAGTNNKKKVTKFFVTGIDIDGDGGNLYEWVEMDKITNVSFSPVNSLFHNVLGSLIDLLDFNNNGDDYKIVGPTANYTNIDTSATNVMATYQYDNKDQIDFSLGAATTSAGGTSNGIGMRMNSLWFKQFNLNLVTLPVKLLDFTANYTKPSALLDWSTSQEHNFSHFIIERSVDGENFSQVALVFGAGESDSKINYSYNDKDLKNRGGIIYYRLKQVDIDGKFSYSSVRILRLGDEKTSITLATFPNPVATDLRITIPSSWQNNHLQIDLYNVSGQLVNAQDIANSSQTESISVASLQKGIYFVQVRNGAETAKQQIVKN